MVAQMLGGGIRRLREAKDWSMEDLAERAGFKDKKTVQRVEQNETHKKASLEKLVRALGADMAEVEYEAGIHELIVQAILVCENKGLPLNHSACGVLNSKWGQRAKAVHCAAFLEKDLLEKLRRDGVTGARVVSLVRELAVKATHKQCDALVQLVGAVSSALIEPQSISPDIPIIDVQGVSTGWSLQIVLNGHRGKQITLKFDDTHQVPRLRSPSCAVQVSPPKSGQDTEQSERELLLILNERFPAFIGNKSSFLPEAVDYMSLSTARKRMNAALLSRRDDDNAPFVYPPLDNECREYLQDLTHSLPSLRIADINSTQAKAVLRLDEEDLGIFLEQCLLGISQRRWDILLDSVTKNRQSPTEFQKIILRRLKETGDDFPSKALEELEKIGSGEGAWDRMKDWIKRWGGALSATGSHLDSALTLNEHVVQPALESMSKLISG